MRCPKCEAEKRQVKKGRNRSGSQRYQCWHCKATYTPEPNPMGYPDEMRQKAVQLYVDGVNFRRIARHLGVNHQTVINWVNAYVAQLEDAPQPEGPADIGELDELHTFVEHKKIKSTS